MPYAPKQGIGHKQRSQNAQPQNEILCSKGDWGRCPQQASLWLWIATSIACVNMLPLKTWYLTTMRKQHFIVTIMLIKG